MIDGLSHITFVVSDLERSARLLVDGLGGEQVYDSGEETFSLSRERFFLVGGLWVALMEGAPTERSYNHVAFKVDDAAIPRFREALERLGVELRQSRPRVAGEGQSLYFYDYDNHLFELHSGTLQQRLARYAEGRASGRPGA